MSIIVYRNGVLAADSGCWANRHRISRMACKLSEGPFGLAGSVGNAGHMREARERYVIDGATPERMADSEVLVLVERATGRWRVMDSGGIYEPESDVEFYAVGAECIAGVALGALHMGATAMRAVEIAIAVGPWAAGPARSVHLERPDLAVTQEEPPESTAISEVYSAPAIMDTRTADIRATIPPLSWREKRGL